MKMVNVLAASMLLAGMSDNVSAEYLMVLPRQSFDDKLVTTGGGPGGVTYTKVGHYYSVGHSFVIERGLQDPKAPLPDAELINTGRAIHVFSVPEIHIRLDERDAKINQLRQNVDELTRMIESLTARLSELEKGPGTQ